MYKLLRYNFSPLSRTKRRLPLSETSTQRPDGYAYNILENPVHVNDLNATVLHALGIDHERFTYKYMGLDQRLTGVEHPKVVTELLA